MFDIENIVTATTVDEAIEALQADPKAIICANGTDVLVQVREGRFPNAHLVCINSIEELKGIEVMENGDIEVGPLTTFNGLYTSDIIMERLPVLGFAADTAGGPQLREVGTYGGNLCNGITSADTASTSVAAGVILRVKGPKGVREINIADWYAGPGRTVREHDEVLIKIIIPRESYEGFSGHYIKYARRKALDIATLGVSCLVKLADDKKTIEDIRLAFGVAGPNPMRAPSAEDACRGLTVDEAVKIIGEKALEDAKPRDSWRASKTLRTQLVRELSRRALVEAATKGGYEA